VIGPDIVVVLSDSPAQGSALLAQFHPTLVEVYAGSS
jgi:hypothetical protein